MKRFSTTIGLEIHIRLNTRRKMFCRCSNEQWNAEPNTNVCPVCLGLPGTLPVINKEALRKALVLGHALNGKIAAETRFDRKHYFYPDLPKGYQISQYDQPIIIGGKIILSSGKEVSLRRIHLEEDAGKLIHPAGADHSLVDLNRAGTPLIEVVTEPEIESSEEAMEAVKILRNLVRHYDVSLGDMEKGYLRCDANISLSPDATPGTPVEVKNLNSFKMIGRALEYEIERQTKILSEGQKVAKETRGWLDARGVTVPQRSKEFASDYRYFPEPDLPPIIPGQLFDLEEIKTGLAETPDAVKLKLIEAGVPSREAEIIVKRSDYSAYLKPVLEQATESSQVKTAALWLVNIDFNKNISTENFIKLMSAWNERSLTKDQALEVSKRLAEGEDFEKVFTDLGTGTNDEELDKEIDKVLSENETAAADIKAGKLQAIGFLVGQVMRQTKGANPKTISAKIQEKILTSKGSGAR